MSEDFEAQLSRGARAAYVYWLSGRDVRKFYPNGTVYRYRNELLKHGVDIFSFREPAEWAKRVELSDVLDVDNAVDSSQLELDPDLFYSPVRRVASGE